MFFAVSVLYGACFIPIVVLFAPIMCTLSTNNMACTHSSAS